MSALSLSLDEYITWAKAHVPPHKQARFITDVYRRNKVIRDARAVIKSLDPKNFMFIDKDIYYKLIDILKEVADSKGIIWKNEVDYTDWIADNNFSVNEWLKYYLNPTLLTETNVAILPEDICVIILGQLKKWYETDQSVHACCLIAYLDQIHFLLMRAGSPEYIEIFNNLAAAYIGSNVSDCDLCTIKGRKAQRILKYGK